MKRFLLLLPMMLLTSTVAHSAASDDDTLARGFLYCAALSSIMEQRAPDPAAKKGYQSQLHMFLMNAHFLTSPDFVRIEIKNAVRRLKDDVDAEIKRYGNFSRIVSSANERCFDLQRNHMPRLMELAKERGKGNFPEIAPFIPLLPLGKVAPESIDESLAQLRRVPGAKVDDSNDQALIISFTRTASGFTQTATHMFTKKTNPAHPAVIFGLVTRIPGTERPELRFGGSYAGSATDFEGFLRAAQMFAEAAYGSPRSSSGAGR